MKKTAIANTNFALIKYWGKRDEELILPQNSSLSITINNLSTKTTIELSDHNSLILNNQEIAQDDPKFKRLESYLEKITDKLNFNTAIKIVSENNFPTSAGLASSASASAALSLALSSILEKDLDSKQLSMIARLGSGSATRSILGGFNAWIKGKQSDGSDSHIEQIADSDYWPDFRIAVCITEEEEKLISSRAGMRNTVETCPIYKQAWLNSVETDFSIAKQAILDKDFSLLGKTAELNALKMHATMISSTPPINYWNQATNQLTKDLVELRLSNQLESYFTIDAGPQVKILYQLKDEEKLTSFLDQQTYLKQVIYCTAGNDAYLTEEHLF